MVLVPVAVCSLQRPARQLKVLTDVLGGSILISIVHEQPAAGSACSSSSSAAAAGGGDSEGARAPDGERRRAPAVYFTVAEVAYPQVYHEGSETNPNAFVLYHLRPRVHPQFLPGRQAAELASVVHAALVKSVDGTAVRCVVQCRCRCRPAPAAAGGPPRRVLTYVYARLRDGEGVHYAQLPAPLEDAGCEFVASVGLTNHFAENSIGGDGSGSDSFTPLFIAVGYERTHLVAQRLSASADGGGPQPPAQRPERDKGNVFLVYGYAGDGSASATGGVRLLRAAAAPALQHCGRVRQAQLAGVSGGAAVVLCLLDTMVAEVRVPLDAGATGVPFTCSNSLVGRVWRASAGVCGDPGAAAGRLRAPTLTSMVLRDYYLHVATDTGRVLLFDIRAQGVGGAAAAAAADADDADDGRCAAAAPATSPGLVCVSALPEAHAAGARLHVLYAPPETASVYTAAAAADACAARLLEWVPDYDATAAAIAGSARGGGGATGATGATGAGAGNADNDARRPARFLPQLPDASGSGGGGGDPFTDKNTLELIHQYRRRRAPHSLAVSGGGGGGHSAVAPSEFNERVWDLGGAAHVAALASDEANGSVAALATTEGSLFVSRVWQ